MKALLKWPLIVTLTVIVLRIILEESGAPQSVNAIFGVAWLQLLMPFYFGVALAENRELPPFVTLAKLVVLYSLCARLMVFVTYSLAYVFQWSAPRFSVQGGGVVGEGVEPLDPCFQSGVLGARWSRRRVDPGIGHSGRRTPPEPYRARNTSRRTSDSRLE